MRDIKYRQRLQSDKWHYWGFINGEFISPMLANGIEDAKKHSQQFTGLLDRHGVEIYEGDIVEFIGHKNRVVEWTPDDNYYSGWYATGGIRPLPLYSGKGANTIEVIGNIYENPELLDD